MSLSFSSFLTRLTPFKVVFLAVVVPRILVLGDFPHIDEGYYIYYAQLICQSVLTNGQLPDVGSCNLYSCLLAPFCILPGNLYIWMRLVDLGFAIVAGLLLCRLLIRESADKTSGLLIAFLCLVCWHVPHVLDAGVKNSLVIAYAALFSALLIVERETKAAWFAAGCLTALAVLLREPFAIYSCLGAVAMLFGYGLPAACIYCMGGIMAGLGLILVLAFGRGNLQGLVEAYLQAGTVVSAEASNVFTFFIRYGLRFLGEFWPFLFLVMFAMALLWRAPEQQYRRRAMFWLACMFAPFIEILSKTAFLYHFSMILPAFAGMLALSLKLKDVTGLFRRVLNAKMFLLASLIVLCVNYRPYAMKETWQVLQDFPTCAWSEEATRSSNTLLAAQVIGKLPGSTLSVSGLMHFLYPLTRRLPPSLGMDDLSRVFLRLGRDEKKLTNFLVEKSPDVLVVGNVQETDHVAMFTKEIQRAINATELYTLVCEIPIDETKNYGWIGGRIYSRWQ